jgi:thiol-disulfide isomerase/thioredoxin
VTGRFGGPLRWLVAGVVVIAAVVIAVWPRGHGGASSAAPPPTGNLAAARAGAGLAPCVAQPAATPTLAAVRVTCLADGAGVRLGALVGGRTALVDVWASWCVPCQQELPALDAYAAQPGAVPVIGVQVQSDQASGLRLLAGLHVHHLQFVYDTGAASRALKLPVGLPVSYLVRSDGTATVITKPSRVLDSVAQVKQAVAAYGGAG